MRDNKTVVLGSIKISVMRNGSEHFYGNDFPIRGNFDEAVRDVRDYVKSVEREMITKNGAAL